MGDVCRCQVEMWPIPRPYRAPNHGYRKSFVAFFVQSAQHPLPAAYIPIFPCRLGTREPLVPDFDWPFADCVVDTSHRLVFNPVFPNADVSARRTISEDSSRMFCAATDADDAEQTQIQISERTVRRRAEREAAGLADDDSRWTTFSLKSTVADPRPGEFAAPSSISAQINYNIESLGELLPSSQCLDEVKSVKRLRAHFSRQNTDRTIIWTIDQSSGVAIRPPEEHIPDFEHSALLDFSTTFQRPISPDQDDSADTDEISDDSEDDLDEWWGGRVNGVPYSFPDAPRFEPQSLQMMYFDVYGTLINNESGIFDALGPLLARSSSGFDRREALSMYFEVESELKAREPTTPYSEILSQAHEQMALRLGLASSADESTAFASSLLDWPLFPQALESLQALHAFIPMLVAIADLDLEILYKTRAFPALGPYFVEIWSWDLYHAYRPDQYTLDPAVVYHDGMGVPRSQRCLVSNALFERLAFGCEVLVPAVWVRDPAGLAAGLPAVDASFVWKVVPDLPTLVSVISVIRAAKYEPPSTAVELKEPK